MAGDGLWPSADQLNLLKAALWQGQDALDAWLAWLAAVDLDGPLDSGTFRLLPLLYCNLHAQGVPAGEISRLKGLYRNAWYLNNRVLHGVRQLLADLRDAGFRVMFLKGIHLAGTYYPKLGARPMNDADIMVPPEQAAAVLAWMDGRGYARHWTQLQGGTEYRHSMPYRIGEQEIDIHWHLLRDCQDPALTRLLWAQARPHDHDGIAGWGLSPADLLFHQLLHGLRWNEEPSIRWVPDAWMILRRHHDDMDWARLVQLCRRLAYCERACLALRFLRDTLRAEVPDHVLSALSRGGGTLVERMERTYVLRDHRAMYDHPLGKLWITFADYQALGSRRTMLPRLRGFSRFAVIRWRVSGRREIMHALVHGSLRRLAR